MIRAGSIVTLRASDAHAAFLEAEPLIERVSITWEGPRVVISIP